MGNCFFGVGGLFWGVAIGPKIFDWPNKLKPLSSNQTCLCWCFYWKNWLTHKSRQYIGLLDWLIKLQICENLHSFVLRRIHECLINRYELQCTKVKSLSGLTWPTDPRPSSAWPRLDESFASKRPILRYPCIKKQHWAFSVKQRICELESDE